LTCAIRDRIRASTVFVVLLAILVAGLSVLKDISPSTLGDYVVWVTVGLAVC
jgi:hypothetical protein